MNGIQYSNFKIGIKHNPNIEHDKIAKTLEMAIRTHFPKELGELIFIG